MLYDSNGKPIRNKIEQATYKAICMARNSLLNFLTKPSPWPITLYDHNDKPIEKEGEIIKIRRYKIPEGKSCNELK